MDAPARAVHGAPAQALADALAALAGLWIVWTADGDLPPNERMSARNMREAAAGLAKVSSHLDAAADLIQPPDPFRNKLPDRDG